MTNVEQGKKQDFEQRLEAMETELGRLRDHVAISQVIASYGPLVDTSDGLENAERLARMWVEDGIYDIGGYGLKSGRKDIAESYAEVHFDMVPNGIAHIMGLPFIEVHGDTAVALCYSQVMRPEGERFYAWRTSANRWEMVRTAEGWKVDRRINRMIRGRDAYNVQLSVGDLDTGTDLPAT
jgi:hypothetical protein